MTDNRARELAGTIIKWSSKVDMAFVKSPLSALQELSKGSALSVYLWLLELEYELRNSEKVMGGYLITWDTLRQKCGISESTLARRLNELELKGFIHREKGYSGGVGQIKSLSMLEVIVKPCVTQQQLEYIEDIVAEEEKKAPAFDYTDFGADDFGASAMLQAEQVQAPQELNSSQAIDYLASKLGGEIPYYALGYAYNKIAELFSGEQEYISSLLVDNLAIELQAELTREQERRPELRVESL